MMSSSLAKKDETLGTEQSFEWAASDARILVTMDKDFGRFVFAEASEHAGIIRLSDVPAARRIELLERVLDRHTPELQARAVVTVRGGRIRISRTP